MLATTGYTAPMHERQEARRIVDKVLPPMHRTAGTPSEDTYTNPAMWQQVRLDSGAYVWVFLCASDEAEPWNLGYAGAPSEDTE